MKEKAIKKVGIFNFRYFQYDLARILGFLPCFLWLRPKWIYKSKEAKKRIKGGALLMFNHTGFIDPVLGMFAVWYRRQHFVAAKELFETKLLNYVFNQFHCIRIDRDNFNLGTFREINEHLKAGNIVSIYPEGHINTDSVDVTSFKSGIVLMALRSGKPIVPIYAEYGKRHRTVLCIGEPINIREKYGSLPSVDTVAKISEELREKEIELSSMIKRRKRK